MLQRRFSSIATLRPFEIAFAICSLYLSLASITTLRTLIQLFSLTLQPLIVKSSKLALYALQVKQITTVLSTLKVALLLLSQSRASLIIPLMPLQVLYTIRPITQAMKLSTKAIALLLLLVLYYTRSALKKRNRIGERGDPWGRPAQGRSCTSAACLLIQIEAIQSKQKASIY